MVNRKYFGDSPKAAKIYARKYFPVEESDAEQKPVSAFPTAGELAEYEQLFEGAAERIVKLIEKEQAQRHDWENKALRIQNLGRRFGQALFAVIVLVLIYTSIALIERGDHVVGLIYASIGFIALLLIIFLIKKQRFNIEKRYHFTNRFHNKYREK